MKSLANALERTPNTSRTRQAAKASRTHYESRKSQEEDLRGGQGVEPTGDEMAIISAPADTIAAFRLGAAVLRGGYQVVKQGGAYILRKELPKHATKDIGEELTRNAEKTLGQQSRKKVRPQISQQQQQTQHRPQTQTVEIDKLIPPNSRPVPLLSLERLREDPVCQHTATFGGH
ncbi:MAG TPA: hypothetical protein VGM98_06725 [Schlesneria sp.]|jgi:hypothetical protein